MGRWLKCPNCKLLAVNLAEGEQLVCEECEHIVAPEEAKRFKTWIRKVETWFRVCPKCGSSLQEAFVCECDEVYDAMEHSLRRYGRCYTRHQSSWWRRLLKWARIS